MRERIQFGITSLWVMCWDAWLSNDYTDTLHVNKFRSTFVKYHWFVLNSHSSLHLCERKLMKKAVKIYLQCGWLYTFFLRKQKCNRRIEAPIASFLCSDHSLSPFLCSDHSLSPFLCSEHSLSQFLCSEHSLSPFLCSEHSLSPKLTGHAQAWLIMLSNLAVATKPGGRMSCAWPISW